MSGEDNYKEKVNVTNETDRLEAAVVTGSVIMVSVPGEVKRQTCHLTARRIWALSFHVHGFFSRCFSDFLD